jgi:RES domain
MTMLSGSTFDLKRAHAAISVVRQLDLSRVSIDEIKVILAPAIEGRIVSAPILDPGTSVFRARIVTRPSHISELSHPPATVAPMGRVNRSGAPVLYCSASREGALFEVNPTVSDTVVIAEWKTTAPMVVNHVGYSQNAFNDLGSRRTHGSWANRPVDEPGGPEHGEVTDFLATTFVRRIAPGETADFYKISIAIAEALFAQDLFHGLMYPTIAMAANSDNVAIKAAFADQHLEFVKAEFFRVDAVREMGFEVLPLDVAKEVDNDGALKWKGRPNQLTVTQDRPLILTAENGRWVARDVSGCIVEPD